MTQHVVVADTEIFDGYFLAAFKNIATGEVLTAELYDGHPLDMALIHDILTNDIVVTFNGANFDMPILWAALAGKTNDQLQAIANDIILGNARPWQVERDYGFRIKPTNHIDLIEVSPLDASLKVYNGRLHGKRMQDLPYEPGQALTPDQQQTLKEYCVNDLAATELLLHSLEDAIVLREHMSTEFRQDFRSKSDAQMGEAIIQSEVERVTRRKTEPQDIRPGTFRYTPPEWMAFETPLLQGVLETVRNTDFRIDYSGRVEFPKAFEDIDIRIAQSAYTLGIGGLHSQESNRAVHSNNTHVLIDADVASQYPSIIMKLGLYPEALGPDFLTVYSDLMRRRLAAKAAKDKTTDKGLKISINGAYGKLGSPYSVMYAPHLMLAVTLTGQLSLLMLIERAEAAGISVVSGNTDGVVFHCPREMWEGVDGVRLVGGRIKQITDWWEDLTGFKLEFAEYRAIYNQSVNTYVAVKPDGTHKGKGAFFDPWYTTGDDPPDYRGQLSKNPNAQICVEAVVAYLTNGTDLVTTIRACTDITRFVVVRKVNGGATWRGQYLGKAVRWYYARDCYDCIRYIGNNNRVPKSDGAMPCMELPDQLPTDIDYDWYVREAESMLVDIGAVPGGRKRGEPDERDGDLFAAA